MTDIVLNEIRSGYNLSKINDNFEKIEDVVNTEVIHSTGDNNVMGQDLDLNSNRIINLPAPINDNEPLRLGDANILAGTREGGSTISEEPPVLKAAGDRWTRCSDMKAFLWYEDGDSGQWIEDRPSYGIDTIQNLSIPYVFDTVADMTGSAITFPTGKKLITKGYVATGDGGGASYLVSTSVGDLNIDFDLGDGRWIILQYSKNIFLPRLGAVSGQDATFNSIAIDAAIKRLESTGGGTIYLGPHDNHFINPIKLRENVYIRGINGIEKGHAVARYTGTAFQDFITSEAGHRNYMGIQDLQVAGGLYQQGRARYCVGFDGFNTRCWIKNVLLRDGLGFLRIDSGYYSVLDNVQCTRPTPKQDSPTIAFTDGEWAQVNGSNTAPVVLEEMNGATINRLQVQISNSEPTTGISPVAATYIGGEDVTVTGMTLESVGTPYSTFNPTCSVALLTNGIINFTGLYLEGVNVSGQIIRAEGFSRVSVNTFTMYNTSCDTLAYNIGVGDLTFDNGQIWRSNCRRLEYTEAAGDSGFGNGSNVVWGSGVSYRSGGQNDAQDSFDTDNSVGTIDGPLQNAQDKNEYVTFPRVIGGLNVTVGSDVNGALCNITGGTFKNQSGKLINCKATVLIGASLADQVLRPDVSSQFYRVYVGKVGNMYLTKSGSAQTDPRGNWIASFETDAGGTASNVQPNPRLSMTGYYQGGTSKALITQESNTPPALSTLRAGDEIMNTSGTSGQPMGWVYPAGVLTAKASYP